MTLWKMFAAPSTGVAMPLMLLATQAMAGGGNLQPVQSTLQTLVQTLTGPIATALALLAGTGATFGAVDKIQIKSREPYHASRVGPYVKITGTFVGDEENLGPDGMAFLREVRSQPAHNDLCLVMLTTDDDPMQRAEARQAGANDYLLKPVTADRIEKVVERLQQRDLFFARC